MTILKSLLLAVYLTALVAVTGLIQFPFSALVIKLALALLGVHLLELIIMFKHVRRYSGGLPMSMLLTLLFGLLHWKPLMQTKQDQG